LGSMGREGVFFFASLQMLQCLPVRDELRIPRCYFDSS
jgi:hypothetical protein